MKTTSFRNGAETNGNPLQMPILSKKICRTWVEHQACQQMSSGSVGGELETLSPMQYLPTWSRESAQTQRKGYKQ